MLNWRTAQEADAYLAAKGVAAYAQMPADAYHATKAVSHSTLKKFARSARKAKWEMDHPRGPSPAMALGSAIHAAILEPEVFEREYRVMKAKPVEPERPAELEGVRRKPKGTPETCPVAAWEAKVMPAYDAAKAQWERDRADPRALGQEEFDTLNRVHRSTYDCPFFRQFFDKGSKESSFFARDEESGLLLRMRADNIVETQQGLFIVDLKTTDCAEEFAFLPDIHKYGYISAAAFYCDVFERATGVTPDGYVIVAVEKGMDNDMQAYYFEDDALDAGRKMYRKWLRRCAAAAETNRYDGYPRRFIKVRAQDWYMRAAEEAS